MPTNTGPIHWYWRKANNQLGYEKVRLPKTGKSTDTGMVKQQKDGD